MLPAEVVSAGTVGVTMVGCMTPLQKARTMKRYQVRVSRLQSLLSWYHENNPLYSTVRETDASVVGSFAVTTAVVLDCTRPDYNDDDITHSMSSSVAADDVSSLSANASLAGQLDESHMRHNEPRPVHVNPTSLSDETSEQFTTAIVTDFAMEDDIALTRRVLENGDVIVRRSSGILSDFDAEFWVYSFCDLFPYGRGGLNEVRAVPIGLEEYLRHCLRLSSRRFACHSSFSLVAFDVVARHRATQAVYIRAKLSPRIMRNIATVNREDLLEHVHHLEQRRSAIALGASLPELPVTTPPVRDLLSAIETGLRAFYGSNRERGQARTQVMSMQLTFGQPAVFFTITPDCSNIYRIANLAGSMPDHLLAPGLDTLRECLEFTKARLGMIATQSPVPCAQYFDWTMEIIVEIILNWDLSNGCSKPGVGLFGITQAYFASTEAQGSTGNLHSHMLIWLEGTVTTVDEYYSACRSNAIRGRLAEYVESIASSCFPIDTSRCPACKDTSLTPVPFVPDAFRNPPKLRIDRSRRNVPPHSLYGADEIIRQSMDIFSSDTAVNPRDWSCETARHILARPDVLPLDGSPRAALLSCHALLESQVHHWYHCRSCFKVTRRTPAGKVCRMFFPKEARSRTEWTKTDTVGLRREIGCEYLNTYLPLVANVFKCNHDVKFLTAAEGPEKAYYMMKYTTKDQNTVENPLAIHLHAYDKAHLRLAECADAVAAGRRCVQSMCCSMTNAQEVSAPLAALYLDRKSPFYSSVEFQNIHLWSCVNQVFNGTGIDVLLAPVNGGSSFQTCGPYLDYIYRPARMENIHLLSFTRLYEKRKNLLGHRFGDNHRQHRSHTVHLRAVPVGACILGKRLPNMRGPEVQPHNREAFQQAMLVLFHPFRCSEELFPFVGPDSNAKYLEWWNSGAPNDARQFLAFSNDYYASREMARERADEDIERYREYIDGASNSSSENSEDESDSGGHRGSFADDCFDEEDTAILTSDRPYTPLIKRADSAAQLAARSLVLKASHAFPYESLTSDILDRCIAHAEQSLLNRESSCPDNQVLQTNPICLPTRVHLLENAISDADAWSPPALFAAVESTVLPSGSSIQSVSRHFQLNEKQYKAFARVGKPFLKSLLSDSDVPQLIGFLGGHPGSRKSQVIRALQGLGSSWGAEDAIRTVAYQGVAAEAANGQTIHKLFKWGIKKGAHAKRYTVHDKEQFARLKLFIMDEVSTTDAKFIGMIDIALRELKNEPRRRFGGVHVLFVGDWLQQLPGAGHPAFLPQPPPPTSHRASRGGDDAATVFLLRQRGIDAYGEIYEVVILEENMRHRDDPQWRDILSRWRVGEYREEDIDLVNHHCYGRNWEADAATEKKAFCPILVTSNALRVEFNELATHQYCEATGATLHYFPASVTHAKKRFLRRSAEA